MIPNPALCLIIGLLCGFVALLAYLKERRADAASWHTTPAQRRRVIRDENGNALMYVDEWRDAA